MKVAVSLPDDLFEEAESLGRRLHKSRSELYRKALEDYLARHDVDRVREAIDRAVRDIGENEDAFARAAAARVLERSEW